jgi:hypothetical protein
LYQLRVVGRVTELNMKFYGSVEELQALVQSCGVAGRWDFREDHRFFAFRGRSGEVLNWWPKTGTVVVQQGRSNSAFRMRLMQLIGDNSRQLPLFAAASPSDRNDQHA